MNSRFRFGLILSFFLALPSVCHGEERIACDVSGEWQTGTGDAEAAGVLCQIGDLRRIYRFGGADQKSAYAPLYVRDGHVRYLFSDDAWGVFCYADDSRLYVVDSRSYKVIASKPWKNVRLIEQDPHDSSHWAIAHATDGGLAVRLISYRNGEIEDELAVPVSDTLLGVWWTPERFVVTEPGVMHVYRRPAALRGETGADKDKGNRGGTSDAEASGGNAPETAAAEAEERPSDAATAAKCADDAEAPASWCVDDVEISPRLSEDGYRFDPNGLMVWDRASKRLSYYVFSQRRWTRASINATASIRGLGASQSFALGITNDMSTVRIVARMGNFLQNRYEAKYWKLPSDPDAPIAVGADSLIALDGGSDNRAQIIDASEMTWKRVALIGYPSPGTLADLSGGELVTLHRGATEAVIVWHARSGQKRAALMQADIDASGLSEIVRVKTIAAMPRYKLLFDADGRYALFDSQAATLSKAVRTVSSPWTDMPLNLILSGRSIVMPQGDDNQKWLICADEKGLNRAETFDVSGALSETPEELLTPKDKWYGYSDGHSSYVPIDAETEQNRSNPEIRTAPPVSHRPHGAAWGLALLAVLAMIGVMFWRNGRGMVSKLPAHNAKETSALIIDIFDDKKRRMITDRDIKYFLEESFHSKRHVRILTSLIVAIGVSAAVALPYFRDDAPATFLSWVAVLSAPAFALVWTVMSWTYWNRRYLLRYGCIVEGKWLNCAKPNQSISYVPEAGKSFELSRNQWHRADYVPIVIFDPRRPEFAIQYTGESEHALTALEFESAAGEPPKGACCFDIARLAIVALVFAGIVCATQTMFHAAYPGTLSEWRLQETSKSYDFAIAPPSENRCVQVCASERPIDAGANPTARNDASDAAAPFVFDADEPTFGDAAMRGRNAHDAAGRNAGGGCAEREVCREVPIDKEERISVPETTFTAACLKLCREADAVCHEQCHKRQLLNILNKAGISISAELDMLPAEFYAARSQAISRARETLFDESLSCGERARRISDIAMWPDDLYVSFFSIYRDPASFKAAGLEETALRIGEDARAFRQLCDGDCAKDSASCSEPPHCAGSIEELKSAACAFYRAIGTKTPQS